MKKLTLRNLGLGKYIPGYMDEEEPQGPYAPSAGMEGMMGGAYGMGMPTGAEGTEEEELYSMTNASGGAGGQDPGWTPGAKKKLKGLSQLGNLDYRQGMPGVQPFSLIGRPGLLMR